MFRADLIAEVHRQAPCKPRRVKLDILEDNELLRKLSKFGKVGRSVILRIFGSNGE
jgi:hypothetical protein